MNKEQMLRLRRAAFELYEKAAELLSVFSLDDIELARFEEELKKIPQKITSFIFRGRKRTVKQRPEKRLHSIRRRRSEGCRNSKTGISVKQKTDIGR